METGAPRAQQERLGLAGQQVLVKQPRSSKRTPFCRAGDEVDRLWKVLDPVVPVRINDAGSTDDLKGQRIEGSHGGPGSRNSLVVEDGAFQPSIPTSKHWRLAKARRRARVGKW